jgi:hypothetical protein
MELEKQVCSLELAKRLKELGVKQESAFSWFQRKKEETYAKWTYQNEVPWQLLWTSTTQLSTEEDSFEHVIAAFTVAELGEMLRVKCCVDGKFQMPQFYLPECVWLHYIPDGDEDDVEIASPTEADARAKMLIYLLENKLITL